MSNNCFNNPGMGNYNFGADPMGMNDFAFGNNTYNNSCAGAWNMCGMAGNSYYAPNYGMSDNSYYNSAAKRPSVFVDDYKPTYSYYGSAANPNWNPDYGKPRSYYNDPSMWQSAVSESANTSNWNPDYGKTNIGYDSFGMGSIFSNESEKAGSYESIPDVIKTETKFVLDYNEYVFFMEETNSNGKIKKKPISSGFEVNWLIFYVFPDRKLHSVSIIYHTKNEVSEIIIPYDDFVHKSFSQYFKNVYVYPNVTKNLFNSMIESLLRNICTTEKIIFAQQGVNELYDGRKVFAANDELLPSVLKTSSIESRRILPLNRSPQEIISNWVYTFMHDPASACFEYYHICSLFCNMMNDIGFSVKEYLIAVVSENLSEAELNAILATNNICKISVPTLESDPYRIDEEINLVKDGIVLFNDHSFADQKSKIIESLHRIISYRRKDLDYMDPGRNLVAICSGNIDHIAAEIEPDSAIIVPTEGAKLNCDIADVRRIVEEMDSLIINLMIVYYDKIKQSICASYSDINRKLSVFGEKPIKNTIVMMMLVDVFFREYLGISVMDDEAIRSFIYSLNDNSNLMNASQAIVSEFAHILSELIRSDRLAFVKKSKNMIFDNDYRTLLIEGEEMNIPPEVVKSVLDNMKTTHSLNSLCKALKHTGNLVASDGNQHPIVLHNSAGKQQRHIFYDISVNILDADVHFRVTNIENEEFMLNENEVPDAGFVSLIKDVQDRTAGKRVCYREAENNHTYVTGQAGYGKTYLMHHLSAKLLNIGNTIVVFDSSNSFTHEKMSHNLSAEFVDKHVIFHNLDKQGIPVNLFDIYRNTSLPSQKKELIGILTAGIGELSSQQSNLLRNVLTDLLTDPGNSDRIAIENLINLLNVKKKNRGAGATAQNLISRLTPLFEDIKACGMAETSWDKFFHDRSKIIVISTRSAYAESGDPIIDMLLASLFNYQHDHSNIPVDIFIDEIQNQNFSKYGPIRKILKEGRKIHLSFFGATQEYYPRSTDIGKAMSKADTQIFLKPTADSVYLISDELHYTKADIAKFDSMERGDIIVKGPLYSKKDRRNKNVILSGHLSDFNIADIKPEGEKVEFDDKSVNKANDISNDDIAQFSSTADN